MKKVFALFVAGLCFIIFVIARLLLSANGVISYGSLKGFAVDSEENIYIGTPKKNRSLQKWQKNTYYKSIYFQRLLFLY